MFYLVTLTRDLDLHPKFFGRHLKDTVMQKLVSSVEGTCNGRYGYVLCVVRIDDIGKGMIRQDGTGFCTFKVKYTAVVCRPFKGEIIDCTVQSVNKMGFFAEAGPLQVFVSNHLIPEDLEYNSVGDPCYVSQDESQRIQDGSIVRLRIVGVKIDQAEIFCIGTIKEDYLGVIQLGL